MKHFMILDEIKAVERKINKHGNFNLSILKYR